MAVLSPSSEGFSLVVVEWCFVEQLKMKDKFNQILIRNRPQLVEEMDCTELLNLLISKNILTRRQAKSISVSFVTDTHHT